MNNETKRGTYSVQDLVRISVLVAIMLLLEVTGLGMIKMPGLEITLLMVPVIVGAIVMGPASGAILGGVFGCISFWECFGRSQFGAVLLGINPIYTFLVCVPTRILAGWLCGVAFKGLNKLDKTNPVVLRRGGPDRRAVQHGAVYDHAVPVLLSHGLYSGLCGRPRQRQCVPVRHRLCGRERTGGGRGVPNHRRGYRQGGYVQPGQAGCPQDQRIRREAHVCCWLWTWEIPMWSWD